MFAPHTKCTVGNILLACAGIIFFVLTNTLSLPFFYHVRLTELFVMILYNVLATQSVPFYYE
jgi:hypothetical protein